MSAIDPHPQVPADLPAEPTAAEAVRSVLAAAKSLAPVLVGDGVPGLRFPGPARMSEALRAPARRFALGDDLLFELDLRAGDVADDQHSGAGQARDEGEHSVHHGDGEPLGRS